MSYQWRPDAGAHEMEDLRSQDLLPEFGTQQEAEDWLGLTSWRPGSRRSVSGMRTSRSSPLCR